MLTLTYKGREAESARERYWDLFIWTWKGLRWKIREWRGVSKEQLQWGTCYLTADKRTNKQTKTRCISNHQRQHWQLQDSQRWWRDPNSLNLVSHLCCEGQAIESWALFITPSQVALTSTAIEGRNELYPWIAPSTIPLVLQYGYIINWLRVLPTHLWSASKQVLSIRISSGTGDGWSGGSEAMWWAFKTIWKNTLKALLWKRANRDTATWGGEAFVCASVSS